MSAFCQRVVMPLKIDYLGNKEGSSSLLGRVPTRIWIRFITTPWWIRVILTWSSVASFLMQWSNTGRRMVARTPSTILWSLYVSILRTFSRNISLWIPSYCVRRVSSVKTGRKWSLLALPLGAYSSYSAIAIKLVLLSLSWERIKDRGPHPSGTNAYTSRTSRTTRGCGTQSPD